MVALRDPVRDHLLFADFAQGVAMGCVLLGVVSKLDYERLLGKLSFVPLVASFALSALLVLLGSGPGASDAKVNLLGFQPVEIIRLLLVLFLAGYFGQRWDVLRHARETRGRLAALTRWVDIPPLEYTLPALVSVALSLLFFFLQRDMGPALIFACLFLALYGMARGSALVPAAGLGMVVGGLRGGLRHRRSAHRPRARFDVALALEQHDPWRRSTGAFAVGVRHRRRVGHGHRAGRSAGGPGGAYRPDSLGAGRGMGLPGRGRRLRAVRVAGLSRATHRRCARAPITNSSWRRAWPRPPLCRSC